MNILFAANVYVDRGIPKDGFPIYIYRVSHALKDLGHNPVIVYCSDRDSLRIEDGIKIYGIKSHIIKFNKAWINALCTSVCRSYYLNKGLKKLIQLENIDLIQFTSLNAISLFYHGNVPAVMRLSSYTKKANPTYDTMDRKTVYIASLLELLAGKKCNAVFAPSNVTAEAFQKDFGKRTYVIETPFLQDAQTYDYSVYENYLKNKKYVLYFGRMYYVKGITIIAEILEMFLEKYPEYNFVFVGDALSVNGKSAVDIIKEGAGKYKDRVIIIKALEHKKLYPIIENSEFVVMPSIIDNFPNSCIEAMSLSKIVIGTRGASFEQLIEDKKSGFLCKIGDSKELYRKMEMAVKMNIYEKYEMGNRARERITKLDPKLTVKKLLKFYKAVIKKHQMRMGRNS